MWLWKHCDRTKATQLEYVVVTDGPYRLHILSTWVSAKSFSTRLRFKASPARLITRVLLGTACPSTSASIAEGTVLIRLTSAGCSNNARAFSTRPTV